MSDPVSPTGTPATFSDSVLLERANVLQRVTDLQREEQLILERLRMVQQNLFACRGALGAIDHVIELMNRTAAIAPVN